MRDLMRRPLWVAALGLVIAITGCARSREIALSPSPVLDSGKVLIVKARSSEFRLRHVRFSDDSLSGQLVRNPACQDCRITFGKAEIAGARIESSATPGLITAFGLLVVGGILYQLYHLWTGLPSPYS